MRSTKILLITALVAIVSCGRQESISEKLWYTSPAEDWFSALPLGNGRLGAMVFGTLEEEHIQMNEESLWAGCPEDPYPENVKEHYQKFRDLNLMGEYTRALEYAMDHLAISPTSIRSYTPLGDLFIKLNHTDAGSYRRELDLETGIHRVEYEIGGKKFRREAFISDKYNAMFFHFSSLDGEEMEAAIRYEREKDIEQYVNDNNVLCIDGQLFDDPEGYDDNAGGSGQGGYHMKFASRLAVNMNEGELISKDSQLLLKGAGEFTVIVSAATDYNPGLMNFDRSIDAQQKASAILDAALAEPYEKIKRDHIRAHSEVYNRVDFCISDLELDDTPTNERIERLKENEGGTDNYLTQVFFQYGRYLLMGSSGGRASLPANLQGIWSKDMWAAWEADYHLNINLQMNYWPADVCNLSDAFEPLSNYVYRLAGKGNTTANKFIGSDGWMAHTSTNIFGRTAPAGSTKISQVNNGYCFPLAGAWMSLSLWRHYQFTLDINYLEETVYPVIQGASQFILDFLVENDKGELVTAPSYSPENAYINPRTGQSIKNTVAATIDIQLINEIFQACLDAEKLLGKNELTESINEALPRLPEIKIGADGTIQEWYEDYEEVNPAHRHVSHLFGLHPAGQITPSTPDLYEAALRTLEKRLSSGGGQTGWSRAWVINFCARFFQGNECNEHINALITQLAAPNLFDLHPPHIFQIDGNLGATAGIAEMLIQSHEENTIRLLPALPDAWKEGHVNGLKARGDYIVDMAWKDGKLQSAKITSNKGGTPDVVYGDKTFKPGLKPGEEFIIDIAGSSCRQGAISENSVPIDEKTMEEWSAPYRNWHYYPDLVIPPGPDISGIEGVKVTDVPTVFQVKGREGWLMSYIGFDGQGYQSFVAESKNLVQWDKHRLAMGYGPEGEFDYGGVVLGAYLYKDYDIKAPRILKKKKGYYYSLYGSYPRQGGYELRPGYEGIARSSDGISWERAKNEPILSVHQEDCGTWEKDCIYMPWLLEYKGKYYNFYNAADGHVEQTGLALSDDLLEWSRYEHNPVIPNGPEGSFNEKFSSDPKVFRDRDHWVCFFFGVGRKGAHIMVAFSRDLYHWTVDPEPIYKAGGNPSGIDGRYAHKISLVWNPANETYYMYYCAVDKKGTRGIGLITSKPLDKK